jgi:predicted nucleic acid-binding protein
MIGATAVHHGFAVLTDNVDDSSRILAVEVIPLNG